jgi:hypothetical protein
MDKRPTTLPLRAPRYFVISYCPHGIERPLVRQVASAQAASALARTLPHAEVLRAGVFGIYKDGKRIQATTSHTPKGA